MGNIYSREQWRGGRVSVPRGQTPRLTYAVPVHAVLDEEGRDRSVDDEKEDGRADCTECDQIRAALQHFACLLQAKESELAFLSGIHVQVCVCMCVCEGERERARARERAR